MASSTTTDDLEGRVLARRYRVVRRIGEGGAGVVYEAVDERLRGPVAIKVLRPELREDEAFVRELQREARAISAMQHPHVLRVIDLPNAGPPIGRVLVMEYARNGSLKQLLASGVTLDDAQIAKLGYETASALDAAHRHGLVHRDVKPGNILLDEAGHVRLADFGLVRAVSESAEGRHAGTPRYMAPEQVLREPLTAAADVYALGLVLWELATGAVPFSGSTPRELAEARLGGDVVNPEPERGLLEIAASCLRLDPSARPSAGTVAERLQALARELPPPAPLPFDDAAAAVVSLLDASSPSDDLDGTLTAFGTTEAALGPVPPPPPRRRHRLRRFLVGFLLAVVAAGAGAGWYLAVRAIQVPLVRGASPRLAAAHLEHVGFFRVAFRSVYSSSVPAGLVVATEPGAGARAHAVSAVVVLVSRGHAPVVVPDVVGFTLHDAARALALAGLEPEVTRAYSPSVPAGVVVGEPGAGTRRPWHTSVRIVVSAGPPPRPVPQVLGEPQQAATSELQGAGFQVRLASAYSTSVPKGDVVSESPAPGTSAAYGSTVTVTVSLGPPDVAAPDLVGDAFAQAESALSDVGLTYGSLTTPGGLSLNGVAQYLGSNVVVVGQSVVPGSEVPVGSAINLVLAPGS